MAMRISKDRVDLDDKRLQKPALQDYSEVVVTETDSGSNYTIDLEQGNVFDITLTANCAFTFANPPASGTAGSITLFLTQDATGGRTVTWPAAVEWVSGSAPTLKNAADALSIVTFLTLDGGTTWHGMEVATEGSGGGGDPVDRQVFTADGTWNKPSSGTVALVEAWGAGGAGNYIGPPEVVKNGGGGGEYVWMWFALSDLGSSESVGVGAGGTSGGDGGDSTFGSYLTAEGGKAAATNQNGDGGGFDGGEGSDPGGSSRFGGGGGSGTGAGGDSVYGGAGGGDTGGTSQFGGDGGDEDADGSVPGGGGGAGDTDGGRGEVRVTVW